MKNKNSTGKSKSDSDTSSIVDGIKSVKTAAVKTASTAMDKVKDSLIDKLEDIRGIKPILRDSGFTISDIAMTMSIPPGIKLSIEQKKKGKNKLEKMQKRKDELSIIQKSIVETILKAYSIEDQIIPYGYMIGQIEIEMAVPPKVHIHLKIKKRGLFSWLSLNNIYYDDYGAPSESQRGFLLYFQRELYSVLMSQ